MVELYKLLVVTFTIVCFVLLFFSFPLLLQLAVLRLCHAPWVFFNTAPFVLQPLSSEFFFCLHYNEYCNLMHFILYLLFIQYFLSTDEGAVLRKRFRVFRAFRINCN